MIKSFAAQATDDIYHGVNSKAARKAVPETIWSVCRRKLDQLNAASRLEDLRVPPANRLEQLGNPKASNWAIRVNDRFRLCFHWEGADAYEVDIVDYH